MNKKQKILKLLDKINNAENMRETQLSRQKRLQDLVDEHSVELVALAAGYKDSTLTQYLREKNPSNIGERAVKTAEYIFSKL